MATNTLNGVNLTAIAQETLDTLVDLMFPLNAFTTDFSTEIAVEGSAVTTRFATQPTSGSLSTGYAANAQNAVTTSRTITLGDVKGLCLEFTDAEWSKSSINLYDIFIAPGANAIADDMLDDAMALITNANYTAKLTTTAANFDADDVADLAEDLTTAKVPKMGRGLFLSPTYYAALAKDNSIQQAYAYGGSEAIRDNRVPRVHGFDVYEATNIPGNSENLTGFASHRQALIVAARTPATPADFPGEVVNVTEPQSGFTLQLRRWYSADDGKYRLSMGAIWGVQQGVVANLKRIVSA